MYKSNVASLGFTNLLQVIKVVYHPKGLSPIFTATLLLYFAVIINFFIHIYYRLVVVLVL